MRVGPAISFAAPPPNRTCLLILELLVYQLHTRWSPHLQSKGRLHLAREENHSTEPLPVSSPSLLHSLSEAKR